MQHNKGIKPHHSAAAAINLLLPNAVFLGHTIGMRVLSFNM